MIGEGTMQQPAWSHLFAFILWRNPARYSAVWTFLTERLDACLPALASGGATTDYMLQWSVPSVGLARPEAMRRWVTEHPLPETEEATKKGLDMLAALLSVRDRAVRRDPARSHRKATGES
jgi:hypothetical protein